MLYHHIKDYFMLKAMYENDMQDVLSNHKSLRELIQ